MIVECINDSGLSPKLNETPVKGKHYTVIGEHPTKTGYYLAECKNLIKKSNGKYFIAAFLKSRFKAVALPELENLICEHNF